VQPILKETPSLKGGYKYYERKGGAMAKLFCENAQTVIQRSGEIHTMQVLVNLEYWIDNN
jgi:hypothetical protein